MYPFKVSFLCLFVPLSEFSFVTSWIRRGKIEEQTFIVWGVIKTLR